MGLALTVTRELARVCGEARLERKSLRRVAVLGSQ